MNEAGPSHSQQGAEPNSEPRWIDDHARRPQQLMAAGRRLSSSLRSISGAFVGSSPTHAPQSSDYLDAQTLRVDGEGMTSLDDAFLAPGRRRSSASCKGDTKTHISGVSKRAQSSKDDGAFGVGRYADQWPSLGHLFARDEAGEPMRRRGRSTRMGSGSYASSNAGRATPEPTAHMIATRRTLSPASKRDMTSAGQPGVEGTLPTITQEPDSILDTDPDNIPRNEDPLTYSNDMGQSLLDSDSDSESESDEDESNEDERAESLTTTHEKKRASTWQKIKRSAIHYEPSPFAKTVAKCVLAYFLASLFTYSPVLSTWMASLLPDRDEQDDVTISNMHFIATVAVYFNPGRSIGGMIEANVYALVAFCYAVALAAVSMLLAEYLHAHGAALVSNIITVVVFVGGGLALVGYAKIKVGRPTLNTACSLVGVLIFTVIVKEGSSHLGQFSTDYIWQVTLVVSAGVLTSNLVCFAVWPYSACTSLQLDIQRNLRSFSTLLKVLTKTFLLDDIKDYNIRSHRLKVAIDNHHTSFVSLKKNLEEAKLEAPFDARLRGRVSQYVYVVESLNVLAQHLGGLRSSCTLQHELVKANKDAKSQPQASAALDSSMSTETKDSLPVHPVDTAFGNYLGTVGPHMRSLVFTCARTLHSLTFAFETSLQHIDSKSPSRRNVQETESFSVYARDVSNALRRFQHEQTIAIKRFYTMYSDISLASLNATTTKDFKADEDVFLIFYFTFLLEEFAKELERLVEALEKIRTDAKERQEAKSRPFWRRMSSARRPVRADDKRGSTEQPYYKTLAGLFSPPSPAIVPPSVKGHKHSAELGHGTVPRRQRLNWLIWRIGEMLRAPETKYAIKTGFGCAVLAAPAFISMTRTIFKRFELQWALISFLVVLSPTVGQSNQMSVHRILGTFAGAGAALLAYTLFPDNNVILPIFGALFSIPCFAYIIGKPQFATTGRFVLLTFNLTALYAYNLRKTGVEVEHIAYHRTVAVIIGVVWATLLNHLVWPTEARRELTRGSSDLLFKLAHIYQKLVLSYSSAGPQPRHASNDASRQTSETQPLLGSPHTQHLSEVQALELHAQVQLIKLEGLLVQTKHEPRLKGPFPIASYKKLLGCCQHLLDLLHTMNQVVSRPDWHSQVRRDFIMPLDETGLRRRMVGAVGLFFWLLASAFHLKTPLPPYFPPAEEARQSVVAAIRELPAVKRRAIRGSSEYLLYFAYALSMKDLIHQLNEIGTLAQTLFGVIGGSTEAWENQFRASLEESFVEEP